MVVTKRVMVPRTPAARTKDVVRHVCTGRRGEGGEEASGMGIVTG